VNLPSLLVGLLCLMLPLWLLAGFGDWLCHRRSRIERTAGPRESALHILLYLLIAVPVIFGLFLSIDAPLLAFMAACVTAHMAVSLWDTAYAQPRRYISPVEQHIHSYQDTLPLFALALVVALRWDALATPAWSWSPRPHPLPWTWGVLLVLCAGFIMIIEELMRCVRAGRGNDEGRSRST
jgi:hypothetical protein